MEKIGYEKMYPASLTKIATAIYALEKGNLNDLVTISENAQQVDGTHHKLMREKPYDGVTGGKTGYVSQSGNTLITTAKRNDLSLIAVILKGSGQQMTYEDTVELLDYSASIPSTYQLVSILRSFLKLFP